MAKKQERRELATIPKGNQQIAPGVYLQKLEDGESAVVLDAANLPVPERSACANWIATERTGVDVEIVFGQLVRRSDRLSAAIVISMAAENVAQAIHGQNVNFRSKLSARVVEKQAGETSSIPEFPEHGERTAMFRASVMNLAFAGPEGEIRLYAVSARSIYDLRHGELKKVGKNLITPVVRIELSVEILDRLCRQLAEIVTEEELPVALREDKKTGSEEI